MYTLLPAAHAQEGEVSEARAFSRCGEWSATDAAHLRRADGGVHRRPPAGARALFAQMEKVIAADVVTHTLLLRALATHPTLLAWRGALLEQMSAEGGDATPTPSRSNALILKKEARSTTSRLSSPSASHACLAHAQNVQSPCA